MGNGREYLSTAEKRKLKKLPNANNFYKLSNEQTRDTTNENSNSTWTDSSFSNHVNRVKGQRAGRKMENSSKQWAESSIWSTVCAMELGLVRMGPSLQREEVSNLYANLDGTVDTYKNKHDDTMMCREEQFPLLETLPSDTNQSDDSDSDNQRDSDIDGNSNFSRMFNPPWSLINENTLKQKARYLQPEKTMNLNAKSKANFNQKKNKRRQYTKKARQISRKSKKKVIQIIERRNYALKHMTNGDDHSLPRRMVANTNSSRYSSCGGDSAENTGIDLEIGDTDSHKTSDEFRAGCRDKRIGQTDCSEDEIQDVELQTMARTNFFKHEFDLDCTLSLQQTISEFVRDKHNYALLPSQMKSTDTPDSDHRTSSSQENKFRNSSTDETPLQEMHAEEFEARHGQPLSKRFAIQESVNNNVFTSELTEDNSYAEQSPSRNTAKDKLDNRHDDMEHQAASHHFQLVSKMTGHVEVEGMDDNSCNSSKVSVESPVHSLIQKSPSKRTRQFLSQQSEKDKLAKLDKEKSELDGHHLQTRSRTAEVDVKMEDSLNCRQTSIEKPVTSVRKLPTKRAKKDDHFDGFQKDSDKLSPCKLNDDKPTRTRQSISQRSIKDKLDSHKEQLGSHLSDIHDNVDEELDSPKSQSSKNNSRIEDDITDASLNSSRTSAESPTVKCARKSPNRRETRRTMGRHENSDLSKTDIFNEFDENQYHDIRRITRGLVRNETQVVDDGKNRPGKLVWGNCMGWWPALVVDADDAGMAIKPDKIWVYWIGEGRISQLREKTQVEPFSTDLEARLVTILSSLPDTDLRYRVSVATLKLLSERFGNPLSKPYHIWARKNLLTRCKLNELDFHPYPREIQKTLDKLREKNIKITEKLLQEKEQIQKTVKNDNKNPPTRTSPEKKQKISTTANGTPKKSNEQLSNSVTTHQNLPLMEQKAGAIVWAKLCGHSWWPAMIIDNQDVGTKEPTFGCQWLMWYGDYRVSEIDHQRIWKFEEGIKKMCDHAMQSKRETYVTGVLNACKDYCRRQGIESDEWTMKDVSKWVSSLDTNSEMSTVITTNEKYSHHISTKLKEMKSNQEVDAERKHNIENSDALESVFAGKSKLETLCLICLKFCDDGVIEHPFFEGILCIDCSEEYKPTVFAYGDDGKSFYCTLCAGSDTVAICDGYDCPRVYCTACLKYLICPKTYDEILQRDPWTCFLCDNSYDWVVNGLVKPRSDWKDRVVQLFRANSGTDWDQVRSYNGKKRKIRVLSLFDGLSTGLLILKKLGIEIEVYYASEINPDATLVSLANFGNQIHRLGDVREIKTEEIKKIAPIDLLIGGSPCNDLSIVNPNRLGLHDPNGTGILFFDYCRILELLKAANEGHHLFWLFENVASMPCKYRLEINKYLGCEPNMIDSADFSPQHRPRLYWSNLPIGCHSLPVDPSLDLQSALTPNCDRHALVKKIQTVTTKVNSLKQGKGLLKPVLMNGEKDSLWITELEAIFGFPRHYTDVKNLSATKRQKLIGQSWSVQTLCAIMRPLRYFFEVCKEADQ